MLYLIWHAADLAKNLVDIRKYFIDLRHSGKCNFDNIPRRLIADALRAESHMHVCPPILSFMSMSH